MTPLPLPDLLMLVDALPNELAFDPALWKRSSHGPDFVQCVSCNELLWQPRTADYDPELHRFASAAERQKSSVKRAEDHQCAVQAQVLEMRLRGVLLKFLAIGLPLGEVAYTLDTSTLHAVACDRFR